MNPVISIILPFYNAESFMSQAIRSILTSTLEEFELILINDGSTDAGQSIAQKFADHDSRVRLYQQENQGMAAALNRGIELSQAEVIARMDADDICHPERFLLQYEMLYDKRGIELISCLVEPFSDGSITEGTQRYMDWVNSRATSQEIVTGLHIESPLIHPSVMFRKSVLDKIGLYREYDGPEDYDLWLRMAEVGVIFSKVKKHLLQYRIHDNNLSRTDEFHYHQDAFFRRKLPYLLHTLRKNHIDTERTLRICGFAKSGKRLFSYLDENGITVEAFIDISPKKVDTTYNNIPILSHDSIGHNDKNVFYLCIIKSWGAMEELQRFFKERNKLEMKDYLIL